MVTLGKRDVGSSVLYDIRSYLGTRVSDVPSRHIRPCISAAEYLDLPEAEVLHDWKNLTEAQLLEHPLLAEGPVAGGPRYETNAQDVPAEPRPRCRRCGKERRIPHPEVLPPVFECLRARVWNTTKTFR